MSDKFSQTHRQRAKFYDIGRPAYPEIIFDAISNQTGLDAGAVIADIGAGTGKVAKGFLDKGFRVYAVEPDPDMMAVLEENLKGYEKCIPTHKTAENTGLPSDSVDLIYCGNSYHWFDRDKVIPEFKRIVRKNDATNIIIGKLRPSKTYYDRFIEIEKMFVKSDDIKPQANTKSPFMPDKCTIKTFDFTILESHNEFLCGLLSASSAPLPEDEIFNAFCEAVDDIFRQNSSDGHIEAKFELTCMMGRVDDLI